jgi:biopolymer transport protein ExbD
MARRKKHGGGGHDDMGHGDRPWVYFMVDCFFLVTQFYVATFHVKADEVVLPQHLPPGGTVPSSRPPRDAKEQLNIHVYIEGGQARYKFHEITVSGSELANKLATAVSASGGEKFSVRVSYDGDVQWADVMTVFNSCSKVKIAECGLIPLRGDKAAPDRGVH